MLKQSSYRPEGWQHLMLEGLKGYESENSELCLQLACKSTEPMGQVKDLNRGSPGRPGF